MPAPKQVLQQLSPNWVLACDGHKGFAARMDQKILYVVDRRGTYPLPFSMIKDATVHRTYASASTTSSGLNLGGAIVGQPVAGPIGAVIGGVSGGRRTQGKDYLTSMMLSLEFWSDEGAGGVEQFLLHKSNSHHFSEVLDARAEQTAVNAMAVLKQVVRIGAEPDMAPQAPPAKEIAAPPAPPQPTFQEQAQAVLADFGWRTRAVDENFVLAIRGKQRGVFYCSPTLLDAGRLDWIDKTFSEFKEANYRGVISDTVLLPVRKAAATWKIALFELRELQRQGKVTARPTEALRESVSFDF